MDCSEARGLVSAEADLELGARESQELGRHIAKCPGCAAALANHKALRQATRGAATYFRAPAELAATLAALPARVATHSSDPPATRSSERAAVQIPAPSPARTTRPRPARWAWPSIAGALTAAFAVAWSLFLYTSMPTSDDRLADEVVSGHVRSLLTNRAIDVASSDRHTVKPWFDGKLDFAPPVRDLTAEGFTLTGGRLDYLDHRPVAALVYRHAQHPINVFVMPAADASHDAAPRERSTRGFNTVRWTQGGMTFWAVSDVDAAELGRLAGLLRAPEK